MNELDERKEGCVERWEEVLSSEGVSDLEDWIGDESNSADWKTEGVDDVEEVDLKRGRVAAEEEVSRQKAALT